MSDKFEKFEVGDTVEVIDDSGSPSYIKGEVGVISRINPSSRPGEELIYFGGRRGGMFPKRFRKAHPSQTITLTHKTNGSKLTAVTTGALTGEKIAAVIDGTTEPVVQFVTADWDVEVVEPPFVFPTKRGAIIRIGSNGLYVRTSKGGGESMRVWRNLAGGDVYSTDRIRNYQDIVVVEFEGLDK